MPQFGSGGGSAAARRKVMTLLALVALVASVLVWAAPSSQAQANAAPYAVASVKTDGDGADKALRHQGGYLVNPTGPIGTAEESSEVTVTLLGEGSGDVDGDVELYKWEILTGPYDWIKPVPVDEDSPNSTFEVPSQAFVDSVRDSDPQKYEITARLTVTDDDGATATDTVTIYLNQKPTAAISLYAGFRDPNVIADPDTKTKDLYSVPGVIDGPGENGNADNEWDVVGGAYVELDGYASTDPDNIAGSVLSHAWELVSPAAAPVFTAGAFSGDAINDEDGGGGMYVVGAVPNGDGDRTKFRTGALVNIVGPPGVGNRHTLYYRLTVCDRSANPTAVPTVCDSANPTLSSASVVKIVVHDISAAPELRIRSSLTATSAGRGDTPPQSTIGSITGVEDQFIVAAGSTVLLSAQVTNPVRSMGEHTFRWTGASQQPDALNTATVRVPGNAEDGDTIDVSVRVINNGSRLSTTVPIQLLVGTNRPPSAEGVPVNSGDIAGTLFVHSITDGFQNEDDGSTVTLRGVATDADGSSLVTAWQLREANPRQKFNEANFYNPANPFAAPGTSTNTGNYDLNGDGDEVDALIDADAALQQAVEDWLSPEGDDEAAREASKAAAAAAAQTALWAILLDPEFQEAEEPLVELDGAFTSTVSFEVPDLKSNVPTYAGVAAQRIPAAEKKNNNRGTLLFFTTIDSEGAFSIQYIYLHVKADDDAPEADAGPDLQVEAGGFARLNGSASSDADVLDRVRYRWDFVGATVDPLPNQRPPLSDSEIKELTGWLLRPATTAEANEPGLVRDSEGHRFKYIVNEAGEIVNDAEMDLDDDTWSPTPAWFDRDEGFDPVDAGGKLLGRYSAYPWFDAPDFSGFNDVKLHFRLNARDTRGTDSHPASVVGTDLNGDGDINGALTMLNEKMVGGDLNDDGDATDEEVSANVHEANVGLDLNGDGDALDVIRNLEAGGAGIVEAMVSAVDSDVVIVTVSRRYFTGNVPSPAFCTIQSLGGPSTFPFDSDSDGVADVCALNTTRRATVARQNALENLGGVFPGQFRSAVIAVCEDPVFRQTDWLALGDEQADLDEDACATERVSPPPAPVDPAKADVFFSGVVTGQDFCTNHSLGGARTYAYDSDDDNVADTCSLNYTQREAVARQRALGTFNVSLSTLESIALADLGLLVALEAKMAENGYANSADNSNIMSDDSGLTDDEQAEYARIFVEQVGREGVTVVGFDTRLTDTSQDNSEQAVVNTRLGALRAKNTLAVRYANALLAECRAAGTQDFGDAASALARDECNPPRSTETGLPPT